MAIDLDAARERYIQTLDDMLLAFRQRYDDQDQETSLSILNALRMTFFGIVPSVFTSGVVYGLDFCPLQQIANSSSNWEMSSLPSYWETDDAKTNDWVITRGGIFDGSSLINIEPSETYMSYVYRMTIPASVKGANCYAIGAVLYSITTGGFSTRMLGQTDISQPPRMIEKTNVTLSDMISSALRHNAQDDDFKVSPTSNEIVVGRFVLDIGEMSATTEDYDIYGSNARNRYPLSSGVPYPGFIQLAVAISSALKTILDETFDLSTITDLMTEIVTADTWEPDFYTYWTTGRTIPSNVKYYYDQLFTPQFP